MHDKKPLYCYVWEYFVKPSNLAEFKLLYGPEGEWVKLFALHKAYSHTILLGDEKLKNRFITVDFWLYKDALAEFKAKYLHEYHALDRKCEYLTEKEIFIGEFCLSY